MGNVTDKDNEKGLPERKSTRLKNYDYSSAGVYFVTICTGDRKQILSHIVGGDVLDAPKISPKIELTGCGIIARKYLTQLNLSYDILKVDGYVIMPDHIHLMLIVLDNGASGTSPPTRQHSTVSRFVSTFKRFCNKEYGMNIWQRGFNDHIIRDRRDYELHRKYMYENPLRWYYKYLNFEK